MFILTFVSCFDFWVSKVRVFEISKQPKFTSRLVLHSWLKSAKNEYTEPLLQRFEQNVHWTFAIARRSVKVTLWDCCVVLNDAWPPIGVFGVMPTPQNVHNVHVHGVLLCKIAQFFLDSIIWPLEIICN